MNIRFNSNGVKVTVLTYSGPKTLPLIDLKDVPYDSRFKHLHANAGMYVLVFENGLLRRYAKNRVLDPNGIGSVLYG